MVDTTGRKQSFRPGRSDKMKASFHFAPHYGPSYTGSTRALGARRLGSIPSGPIDYC